MEWLEDTAHLSCLSEQTLHISHMGLYSERQKHRHIGLWNYRFLRDCQTKSRDSFIAKPQLRTCTLQHSHPDLISHYSFKV
jgi:hypothetical protein